MRALRVLLAFGAFCVSTAALADDGSQDPSTPVTQPAPQFPSLPGGPVADGFCSYGC